MKQNNFFSLFVFLLSFQLANAQSPISGIIRHDKNGSPIAGATIIVKNSTTSTVSGVDGAFTINASPNATLVFSYIGYQTVEMKASNSPLIVKLDEGENSLSEVVVTGYTTIQRRKFAGAVASVSAEDVRTQPFGSFDQALQGQASGVSVVANSGQPGSNAVVRIRGNGSISGGNVPLYIMDGIEITAADFASLNQGDFERVEILKDAVASGQYGSRGANGVIVITTRRGRAGQMQLNYDAQLGFSKLPEDRLIVMNSQQKIDYEFQRGNPYGWTTAQADSLRQINFSWKDALFQTGVTHQHMLSASGGSQTSRFFASLSYMDQDGILKTTGLKRYTARINIDNNIKNWRFGMNVQGGFSKLIGTSEANTSLSTPLNAIRWGNPYERDINPNTGDYQQLGGKGLLSSGQNNAAMELFLNYNSSNQVKGIATSYLEFHFPFLNGLYARTNWGIDYSQNETAGFTSPKVSRSANTNGSLTRSMNRGFRYTGTTSLNYKKDFGKHEIEAGLFTEVVKYNYGIFSFTGYGFTNGFTNEAGITPGSVTNSNYIPVVSGSGTANGILSYFGIVNYGYNKKYYATLVGRRDGSSRFGVNNRFANFGSVGLTWVASDEPFVESLKVFDDLRVRVTTGTTGNQQSAPAGDYPIPTFARTSYNGVSGWAIGSLGNLDYTWETNQTKNVGLDFAILKRRVSGTVEVYDRLTKSLFYGLPIDPAITGFTSIQGNFGKMRNRGFEFMLRGDVIRSKNFKWSIEGNITNNKNRIIDLPQDSVVSGVTILAKGKPLNSLYLVEFAGVNPDNGNAQYKKRDGTITQTFSVNDKVIWGTSDAPWFGGISTSLSYKGFELSGQLNYFLDRQMYNNDMNNVTNPTYFYDNMSVEVLNEWKKAGDITNVPRPTSSGGNSYQTMVTRFLEDADFWRLRNVMLSYTFPSSIMSKLKMRSARLFVQGQNWWTSTKFKSFDPEMTGTSLTGAQYPALVQTTFGLSIGF